MDGLIYLYVIVGFGSSSAHVLYSSPSPFFFFFFFFFFALDGRRISFRGADLECIMFFFYIYHHVKMVKDFYCFGSNGNGLPSFFFF